VVIFVCHGIVGGRSSNNNDRVLLEKVTAITLEDGKQTNARRTSPIPQVGEITRYMTCP
jgi:hypothetical protein